MRRRFVLLAAAAAILTAGCAATYDNQPPPPYDASPYGDSAYFYDDLAPYGTWVDVAPYGWAWCPLDVPFGWRPYAVGAWAYTDYGWMWMSGDPWGSIPYRYGRWTYDDFYGWIWIPGDVWAPSWTAWRYGDGWVGWAPLPPEADWSAGAGLSWGPSNLDQGIDRFGWSFCRESEFGAARQRLTVEPASRNVTLLSLTRDVTHYEDVNNVPVFRGLSRSQVERAVGRSIPQYQVVERSTPPRTRMPTIRGQNIEVYRPPVQVARRLRERLDASPPGGQALPQRLLQRQEQERQQMAKRGQQELKQLEQEQQRELRQPPRGMSVQQLEQRHQAERKAQQELIQRQEQMMREREARLRERSQSRPAPRAEPRTRGSQDQGQGSQGQDGGRSRDRGGR
jgi:hypothetical protein